MQIYELDQEEVKKAEEAEMDAESEAETEEDAHAHKHRAEKKQIKKYEAEIAELHKKLEKAEAEAKEASDRYLRMLAEYDNYRKRTQKEKESIYTDAYGDILKELLPVIDNLELAARHRGGDAAALQSGIEMVLRIAEENLGKLGIEAFGEKGEEFDPNTQTAVLHVEDETLGESVVAEVLQRGYRKGDRVIRYAVVKVAN